MYSFNFVSLAKGSTWKYCKLCRDKKIAQYGQEPLKIIDQERIPFVTLNVISNSCDPFCCIAFIYPHPTLAKDIKV